MIGGELLNIFLDGKFGPLWKINVQELALFMFTSNFIFEAYFIL